MWIRVFGRLVGSGGALWIFNGIVEIIGRQAFQTGS